MVHADASEGLAPADASSPRARAASGKFQTLDDAVVHSPRGGKLHGTPLSQPSTAPSTPSLSFGGIDGEGHGLCFYRCFSGTSTIEPVMEHERDEQDWDDEDALPPLPFSSLEHQEELDRSLLEVKELYKSKFGKDVDEESDEDERECEYDQDGTPWIKHVGTGPLTLSVLHDKLAEVKELFKAKYGRDVDSESEDCEYDEDGTPWIKTVGTGPLTVDGLEDMLAEVKELYKAAYGQDADAESDDEEYEYDADGMLWIKTTGKGPLTADVLEERIDEAKQLYEAKFGVAFDDSDAESEVERDEDGTPWIKTVGTGPLTVRVLQDKLTEVKELFRLRYGQDVDDESEGCEYDADGTPWIKTEGTGPLTVDALEERLEEVKELYRERYGQDVDDESDGYEYDADGTPWIKTVGSGPLTVDVLEERLAEVKELYQERYGKGVDEPDDEYEYDEEGTPWLKVVGTGPLTLDVLEEKLAEVKDLYNDAFGRNVDDESRSDGSEHEYDADGTPWVKIVGEGPLTVSVLEDRLADVKALYAEKYGHDVDEGSEDGEQLECDEDGTLWIKTVGTGPLTVSVLEERIEEVKELYERHFGRFVEEESEDEEPDLQFDQDGTLWLKWEGAAASSCEP